MVFHSCHQKGWRLGHVLLLIMPWTGQWSGCRVRWANHLIWQKSNPALPKKELSFHGIGLSVCLALQPTAKTFSSRKRRGNIQWCHISWLPTSHPVWGVGEVLSLSPAQTTLGSSFKLQSSMFGELFLKLLRESLEVRASTKWKGCSSSKIKFLWLINTKGFDRASDQTGDTLHVTPFFQAAIPNKLEASEHSWEAAKP